MADPPDDLILGHSIIAMASRRLWIRTGNGLFTTLRWLRDRGQVFLFGRRDEARYTLATRLAAFYGCSPLPCQHSILSQCSILRSARRYGRGQRVRLLLSRKSSDSII